MSKEDIIKRIKNIVFNNYKVNLDNLERESLVNKIDEIDKDNFSKSALETLKDLLDEIEHCLKSENNQNPHYRETLETLLKTTTESTRDNIASAFINLID